MQIFRQALLRVIVTLSVATRSRRQAHDRGASLIEYTLLVALIALACIAAVTFLGDSNSGSIGDSASQVATAGD
jgi:Flp pilus assembly pilin Flp